MVVGYGPNEDGQERGKFWNDMDRTLDSVGDLNGWIEDRTRAGITGAFWSSRGER